jgi:hypothetical protein
VESQRLGQQANAAAADAFLDSVAASAATAGSKRRYGKLSAYAGI